MSNGRDYIRATLDSLTQEVGDMTKLRRLEELVFGLYKEKQAALAAARAAEEKLTVTPTISGNEPYRDEEMSRLKATIAQRDAKIAILESALRLHEEPVVDANELRPDIGHILEAMVEPKRLAKMDTMLLMSVTKLCECMECEELYCMLRDMAECVTNRSDKEKVMRYHRGVLALLHLGWSEMSFVQSFVKNVSHLKKFSISNRRSKLNNKSAINIVKPVP